MRFDLNARLGMISWPLLLAMGACTPAATKPLAPAPQTNVEAHELDVPNSERYEDSPNTEYVQALAYPENKMPGYPADLLARRLTPAVISVRLLIDATGRVSSVQAIDAGMTPEHAEFYAAAREASLGWKFSPLIRLDLRTGPVTVVDGDASVTYKGLPTPLPFHLDYAFHFSQHDGQPHVEVGSDK